MSFNSTFSALSSRGFGVNTSPGWIQQAILQSNDITDGDQFGSSVAMNSDGTYLVIGADNESTSPNTQQGAVYVFTRSGSTWTQQAKILANDPANGDLFGRAVAINNAGDTIAVGVNVEDTPPTTNQGAVYIFTRSGSTWTQQDKLLSSDRLTGDGFGRSVSLDGSGNYIIIGASTDDTSPYTNSGSVYIFTRSGSTWTEQTKIYASDPTNNAGFGTSVQISNDSNYAVVGAPQNTLTEYGKVYVFARSGSTWTQQLNTSGSGALTIGRGRGMSVTIDSTGANIVFASRDEALSAWFFTRSGSSWTETQVIQNIIPSTSPPITNSISSQGLSTNSNISETMLGLYIPSITINNKVYNINYGNEFFISQIITGTNTVAGEDFGYSVSIAQSANYVAIGTPLQTAANNRGVVYIMCKLA